MLFWFMTLPDPPDGRVFLTQLYRDYHKLMYWVAKQYIDDDQDRADIVQDSLLRLVQKADTLRTLDQAELNGYVMVTVRHTAYNYLRDQQIHRKQLALLQADEAIYTEDDVIAGLDAEATLLALGRKLTREERILLEGKFILDRTDSELAELLHCKVSTLRSKLHRARRNLRKYQQELEGGAKK